MCEFYQAKFRPVWLKNAEHEDTHKAVTFCHPFCTDVEHGLLLCCLVTPCNSERARRFGRNISPPSSRPKQETSLAYTSTLTMEAICSSETSIDSQLDGRVHAVQVPVVSGIFLLSTPSRLVLGPTQPPIQCVQGALSPGIKRPGREADHSPPSNAEVKNTWIYTCTPPYAFMAWCLIS
jgi:hypothetical protein